MVVAGVDLEPGGKRRRELGDEVEATDLDRVLADLACERVDRALDRVRCLRPARTAVCIGRRRMGEDASTGEVVRFDVVAAGIQPCPEQRDAGREQLQVRAHRRRQPNADCGDLAFGGRRELDLLDHVAPVDRRLAGLAAFLDPLHRPAELAGERDGELLLGVDVQFRAEGAADLRGDHSDLRLGDAQRQRQQRPQDVRDLRRRPDRVLALGGDGHDEDAARLDRGRDQAVLAVALRHSHGRFRKRLVDVAGRERPLEAAVRVELVVNERRAVGKRFGDVGHGRQRLVLDLDELGRVLRQRAAVGDDDRDRVAGVARLVARQRPMVRDLDLCRHRPGTGQSSRDVAGDILARVGGDDSLGGDRLRGVDAHDPGMREGAADERHPDHPRDGQVVDVAPLAGEELRVLLSRQRGADRRRLGFDRRHLRPPLRRPGPP
jgi:hypothetical protein